MSMSSQPTVFTDSYMLIRTQRSLFKGNNDKFFVSQKRHKSRK